MRSVSRSPRCVARTSTSSVAQAASTRRAWWQATSPAGVSVIAARPPGRTNSDAERLRSSEAIWCEIADCV